MNKISDSIRAGEYERQEDGAILLPREKTLIQGRFIVQKRGVDGQIEEDDGSNLIVNQGLDYILAAALGQTAGISNWYIALFSGDVTVLATWTAANFASLATEFTDYDEATRGAWTGAAVASAGSDSFSNKASFTSSSDANDVRGAAMISASAKSATSGTLLAARRFSSDKVLNTGEVLDVGYGLQLTAV